MLKTHFQLLMYRKEHEVSWQSGLVTLPDWLRTLAAAEPAGQNSSGFVVCNGCNLGGSPDHCLLTTAMLTYLVKGNEGGNQHLSVWSLTGATKCGHNDNWKPVTHPIPSLSQSQTRQSSASLVCLSIFKSWLAGNPRKKFHSKLPRWLGPKVTHPALSSLLFDQAVHDSFLANVSTKTKKIK